MAKGWFIAFEGIDGCGKSTQAARLAAWLGSRGWETVLLHDPGSTEVGERIRSILLDRSTGPIAAECELLLYEAARAELVTEAIRPALDAGAVVICDRFADSTRAYQGAGRSLDADFVERANRLGTLGVVPDLTLLIRVAPEVALGRCTGEPDRMEAEGLRFLSAVDAAYERLAASGALAQVDGERSEDEVFDEVVALIAERLPCLVSGSAR